jgi:hypothetical protein
MKPLPPRNGKEPFVGELCILTEKFVNDCDTDRYGHCPLRFREEEGDPVDGLTVFLVD